MSAARTKRLEYRKLLAAGKDPSMKRKQKDSEDEYIFENISNAYLEKVKKGIAETTFANYKRYVKYMNNAFGKKNIDDITIRDISTLLLWFDDAGKEETARRLFQRLKSVYMYALSRGIASHNTAYDINAKDLLSKKEVKHFDYIDNEKEFADFLVAIDDYFGDPITKLALKYASMTFLRPANVRGLRWEQINRKEKIIEYPECDMKTRKKHIVPLTKQIEKLIENVSFLSGHSIYVFPSPTSSVKMLSENTLNMAIKRIGFRGKMTTHGIRHSASTFLHENMHIHSISSQVIEMQMAHSDANKIRGTYNHATYLPERRRLMEWWCDYLDELMHHSS